MKCPYCGEEFSQAAYIVDHVRGIKCDRGFVPASSEMCSCPFCGESVSGTQNCTLMDYRDHIEACAAYQASMLTGTPVVFRGAV